MRDCTECAHEPICTLWRSKERQCAASFCLDGCDYFKPETSPTDGNKPLTIDELRTMGGQPIWRVELRPGGGKPHWEILRMSVARWPEDSRYGERWIAYRYKPCEWVNVQDDLPKKSGPYFVSFCGITAQAFWNIQWWELPSGIKSAPRSGSVTHWMPLPEPPEVG